MYAVSLMQAQDRRQLKNPVPAWLMSDVFDY
jgi:hypothetical protein